MMRTPELKEFAKAHGMKMITVSDLITYRRKTEILVERVTEADMPTKYGDFKAYGYVNKINGEHHIALVKGDGWGTGIVSGTFGVFDGRRVRFFAL